VFQNVQMFNDGGELLMFFGSAGRHAGSMSLPAGITVSDSVVSLFEQYLHPAFRAERIVLVTNQFGLHKVAVYALGRLKEGRTIDDIATYAGQMGAPGREDDVGDDAGLPPAIPRERELDPDAAPPGTEP
jgi:hypothetical protein